jgi:hypothetical protein
MKATVIFLSCTLISSSAALAQGNTSGRGSITGDPASSTASPSAEPNGTTGIPAEVAHPPLGAKTTTAIRDATKCLTAA